MSRLPGYMSMSPSSSSFDSLSRSSLSPSPTSSVGNSGTATPTGIGIGRSPHKTDIRQVFMSLHRKPPPHPSHDNDRKLNIYGTASQFLHVEPITTTTSSNVTRDTTSSIRMDGTSSTHVDTTSSNTTHVDPTSSRPTRIHSDSENGSTNGYHDTHTSYYRGTGPTHPFLHSFTSSIRAPTPAQGEYDTKWNDEFPTTPRCEGGVSYDGPPSVSPARFHTDSTCEHPLPSPSNVAPPSSRIYILFSLCLVTFFRILFDNICYIGNRFLESWHGCRDDVEIQHIVYGEREYQVMDRIVRTKPLDTCDDPKQIMKRYHAVHDQRYIIRAITLIWSMLPSFITHITTYIIRSIWGVPAKSSPPASHESNRTPIPVVYFHGGGWCCVSKDLIRPYITFFTQSLGHTLYNVDYPRSPEYVFPHALISAIQALTYIKQKDGHDRVILAGDSAGGNLAVMLTMLLQHQTMRDAFNQQIRGAYPRSSSGLCIDINELPSIAAVVVAYGTMDRQSFLAPSARFPWIVGFTMRLLYNIYRNDSPNAEKKAKSQSDAIYFERTSNFYGNFCPLDFQAFLDSTFPPTCMVIGTEDPLYDGNRRFAETLRRLNVPVRECIYGNLLHGFLTFPWDRRRFRAQLDLADWFHSEHDTVTIPIETDGKEYMHIPVKIQTPRTA